MKYRSIATPKPSEGYRVQGKNLVVPNQAMSLEEILSRFTRGEKLEIGRSGQYDPDGEDDLEKVANSDLVDREEYIDKMKSTQKDFDKQEKKRQKKLKDEADARALEEARKRLEDDGKVKP